ncbi:MAG TPA: HU family DNA-binding protein [Chloroflexota bacterium]|nr:HU family DNA-binding protein [Chloroflexota bacterium]
MVIGKTELAGQIAQETGLNKSQATRALDATLNAIGNALGSGDEVRLTGFGTFRVSETKARTGRNPRTGAPINIAAGRRPGFTAGSRLRDSVQKR